MGEMTTELETRSNVVSGTVRPTSYSGRSESHLGFPEWGRPSETRLYVTSGAIPPMQFLQSYRDRVSLDFSSCPRTQNVFIIIKAHRPEPEQNHGGT